VEILKNAWIDIAVTALIVLAVVDGSPVATWGIYVYTPIMVLLKLSAFMSRNKPAKFKPQDAGVPIAVYHVLYAVNAGVLLYGALRVDPDWWWVAASWAIIWLLSAAAGKGKPVSTPKPDNGSE
jgi:hypothetical protein